MENFRVIPVGPLAVNCYMIFDDKSKKLLVVDPGDDADLIISASESYAYESAAILLTHAHVDHIGGLPNILFVFHKLNAMYKTPLYNDNTVKLYLPDKTYFEPTVKIALGNRYKNSKMTFNIEEHVISDGVIYEDENVKVTAYHNNHLGEADESGWHSFSFVIEAEGKRIVCTGDIKDYSELDLLPVDSCDLLIGETGHHKVSRVLECLHEKNVKRFRFIHHGREILADRGAAENTVLEFSEKSGIDVKLCFDGMTEEL